MDVSVTVVNRYRDLPAGVFMIRVLPLWFENLGKRIVKSSRIFLRDSGVLHFLLGLEAMKDLPAHPRYGASWEGFALEQTLIAHGERETYFYDTQRGAELDLMLLRRGRRWGFEFKCTDARERQSPCMSPLKTWGWSICGSSIPALGSIRSPTPSPLCP